MAADQLPGVVDGAQVEVPRPVGLPVVVLVVNAVLVVVVNPRTAMSSQFAYSVVALTEPENRTRTVPPTGSA